MARVEISEVVLDTTGAPINGASVQVNKRNGAAATVYSAETGTGTLSNPLITGAFGRIEGWLEEGQYDLDVTYSGNNYVQRYEASVGGGNTPVFNVKSSPYGAKGDGTTDDTTAIQSAINAAIAAGGGIVVMPKGTYRTTAPLDFSAMKGNPFAVRFEGAGRGNIFGTTLFSTLILNDHTGPCIKAYGTLAGVTNQFIDNLQLANFGIKLNQNIGSNYAIDFDYVWSGWELDKIYIWGNGLTGKGVQIRNFAHGQGRVNQLTVREFGTGSIGFRIAVEVTANVDTAPNSGNVTMSNCLAMNVDIGYQFGGSNLLNGMTFNSLKAVRSTALSGSIGYDIQFQLKQSVFNGCHSENFEIGFKCSGCEFNDFDGCGSYHPSALVDANTTGWLFDGGVCNHVTGHVQKTHYGVRFINDAKGNIANVRDRTAARVVTAIYDEQSTTRTNLMVTGESNPWTWVWGVITNTYEGSSAASVINRFRIMGDSNFRMRMYADGKMEYNEAGDGNIRLTTQFGTTPWMFQASPGFSQKLGTLAYSASMTPSCRTANILQITVTNGTAFTINAPTNPPDAGFTMDLEFEIINSSGGVMGAATWNAIYKFAGGTAPTMPANGKKRLIRFRWDGTQWLERERSTGDLL